MNKSAKWREHKSNSSQKTEATTQSVLRDASIARAEVGNGTSTAGHTGQPRVLHGARLSGGRRGPQPVEEAVGEQPEEEREQTAEHFRRHRVVVDGRQHERPVGHQRE